MFNTRALFYLGCYEVFGLGLLTQGVLAQPPAVKAWEEQVSLPTYEIGAPLTVPQFYHGRAYQGAQKHFYPYPVQDKLTYVRKDESYKMLYLENKYIKIGILPEIGGRLFYALDKTNNYKFLYSASVVKPGLVGMLGAWLDGGIEWNVPHHHRPSVYMPVQYQLADNADGSKTIWVGEMELNHRMRWLIGLTLRPDKSYVEGTFKLINATPVANSFLYFANFGVHASPDYQVIFPPSTEVGTYHAKTDFVRWPIADGDYRGIDFTGQDISWWKNHIQMNSIFAHDCIEDWFGGYDHGKHAGVIYVADHNVSPGKKFWTWGAGEEGQMWDKLLTEPQDGAVMELMAGAYSDNEPDYSWIQPAEVKVVKQYWYPFQNIGVVKNANLKAAMTLEIRAGNTAFIGLQATSEYPHAKVMLSAGNQTIYEENITVAPGQGFTKEIKLPKDVRIESLRLALFDGTDELISYSPYQRKNLPLPMPAQPPPAPSKIKTNEETYLAGLRLEQFFNPAAEPYPWYAEVLKRDPGDEKVNAELGILYWKRGMFKEAEEKLRAAVGRLTHNYTRPKDGEPLYYLALTLKAQGKNEEAYKLFYAATWSYAWSSSSYYELAALACMQRDFPKAIEFLDRSISTNTSNANALDLKATVLLKLGKGAAAAAVAATALALDPLDVWALREQKRSGGGENYRLALAAHFDSNDIQPYLETVVRLADAGLWSDGIELLKQVIDAYPDKSAVYPMVYYWLGYLNERAGNEQEAMISYNLASRMPADYCFPFRVESIEVLRRAMAKNPNDARAPYYLGNLVYERQPKEAVRLWETARSLDSGFAMAHRNLADAYAWSEQDFRKAIKSLERAVALDPNPKFLAELDELYEQAGVAPLKRLESLEKHPQAVADRDDSLTRLIRLNIQVGRYGKALDVLQSGHHYTTWEGGRDYSAHSSWEDAQLLSGHEARARKQYKEALKHYEAALEYPESFSEGRPVDGGKAPIINYYIGLVVEALGDAKGAKSFFEKTLAAPPRRFQASEAALAEASSIAYHRGCAALKLGRVEAAAQAFDALIKSGQEEIARKDSGAPDYFAKFGGGESQAVRVAQAHYTLGLGYLGAGKLSAAKAEFERAVQLNVNHLQATYQLASLNAAQH